MKNRAVEDMVRFACVVAAVLMAPISALALDQSDARTKEGWRDPQGRAAPDADDRKSVKGFAGWVIVTSDANWKEKWETPSSTTPNFTTVKDVQRGKPVFVLTFFANPQLTPDGKAEVMCEIEVIRPDGTRSTHQEDAVCFKGPLREPRLTYLSAPVIGFVGDGNDPLGEWVVRITLKDNVRQVALPLKTSFALVMDTAAPTPQAHGQPASISGSR